MNDEITQDFNKLLVLLAEQKARQTLGLPNPHFQRNVPKTVGTVTNPGITGRNINLNVTPEYQLNPGEVIMNKGKENAMVVGEGAPRGWLGIPRVAAGIYDATLGRLHGSDLDKRGSGPTDSYGNPVTEGLGRKPQLTEESAKAILDAEEALINPLPSEELTGQIADRQNQYAMATLPTRLQVQAAEQQQQIEFMNRMLPNLRKQLLQARLETEAYSPGELQKRLKTAADTVGEDRRSLAAMQNIANQFGAPSTTIGRRFG